MSQRQHQQKQQHQPHNSSQPESQSPQNQPSSQFVKEKTKGGFNINYDKLLIPVSIFLSGLIITAALIVCYRAYLSKAVTKANLKETIAEALKEAGVSGGSQAAQPTPTQAAITAEQTKALFTDNNVVFGDSNRKVTFIEFSDPSCPFCHLAAGKNPELNAESGDQFKLVSQGGSYVAPVPEMKKLVDEGKASYIWIYTNGHGNGEIAAQALYCAQEKGKFWDVHDKFFSNAGYNLINNDIKNDKANAPKLVEFIKDIIEPTFMTNCLDSGKYADKLKSDEAYASSLGVSGTPGYFINTTNYAGAYSYTQMKATVDDALKG